WAGVVAAGGPRDPGGVLYVVALGGGAPQLPLRGAVVQAVRSQHDAALLLGLVGVLALGGTGLTGLGAPGSRALVATAARGSAGARSGSCRRAPGGLRRARQQSADRLRHHRLGLLDLPLEEVDVADHV